MFSKHTFGARNYGPSGMLPGAASRLRTRIQVPNPEVEKARRDADVLIWQFHNDEEIADESTHCCARVGPASAFPR